MSGKIMVFDHCKAAGEALAGEIRGCHKWLAGAEFTFFEPGDVFALTLPERPRAAFFAVSDMYEAEAAKKFRALFGDVPLVIVSESGEYAIWSYSVGARDYMRRPLDKNGLLRALKKCGMGMPSAAS